MPKGSRATSRTCLACFVTSCCYAGCQASTRKFSNPRISLAGSYVAKLHRHAEGYGSPEGATFPRWDWDWSFGESANLWSEGTAFYSDSDMDAFRVAARRVREELQRLGEESEVFGVIHRDLKLENLLFDGPRVGAVDFDLCGLGYYLFDLYTMRDSLRTHHADRVEPLWAAYLAGYERERPLPRDLQRYLTTFEAMQKMAMSNRQIRLLGCGPVFRAPAPEQEGPHEGR